MMVKVIFLFVFLSAIAVIIAATTVGFEMADSIAECTREMSSPFNASGSCEELKKQSKVSENLLRSN